MKKIHLICNAHIDPIWQWDWQEGASAVLSTFQSAVNLAEKHDYIFCHNEVTVYKYVEEYAPELFIKIQELVKQGKWHIMGGWYLQPDCNMPSGESFARQALYSQLYYYEKFGKICKTGYNVDSFGHSAFLPQFLTKAGMTGYVMQRPSTHENKEIPENLFWWDSADGSRIMTYRIPDGYGASGKNALDSKMQDMEERANETGHGMMLFYGVGNHGGGPTKGDIEYLKENLKREGFNDLEFSSPDDFFEELMTQPLNLPSWGDELQHHASGCYSATSLVKELNRKSENLLASAEKWDTISSIVTDSSELMKYDGFISIFIIGYYAPYGGSVIIIDYF